MTIKTVLDFVTYKERLENAAASMTLAYYDYMDNNGSSDADWFWNDFQTKRKAYKELLDEVKTEEELKNNNE